MTPNTYFPENDAPDAADDDAASPDSRIVYFSLKRNFSPKSMLNFFCVTVTDSDAATNDASPNAIDISRHVPNTNTVLDTAYTTT